jgi:hypothetical protein
MKKILEVDLSHFKYIKVIGAGEHSIVWLAEKRTAPSKKMENENNKEE